MLLPSGGIMGRRTQDGGMGEEAFQAVIFWMRERMNKGSPRGRGGGHMGDITMLLVSHPGCFVGKLLE